METEVAKRACVPCKSHKIKCSRTLPTCSQCERTGRSCTYVVQHAIRFRDQTDAASNRAIQQWRARSKKADTPPEPRLQLEVLSAPIVDLARQRFLYDFAETAAGIFSRELQSQIAEWILFQTDPKDKEAVHHAIDAVAMANFGRRHNDRKATAMAIQHHGVALKMLRGSIADQNHRQFQTAIAAILLGLYQHIHKESRMTGSWIHHFCGAVNIMLALEENSPQVLYVSRLLTKQALVASFRMEHFIPLPKQVLKWMEEQDDLHSTTMKLVYRTAEFCLGHREDTVMGLNSPDMIAFEALALDHEYEAIEHVIQQTYPWVSMPTKPDSYPQWYWPLSKDEGSPLAAHSYHDAIMASIWNSYRLGRINLLGVLLNLEGSCLSEAMQQDMLELAVRLTNDMCDSIYYIISNTGSGRPPPSGFHAVTGSAAYSLHVFLPTVKSCVNSCPRLAACIGPARLAWLDKVRDTLADRVGISEALVWRENDDEARRAALSRLNFAGSSSPIFPPASAAWSAMPDYQMHTYSQ